METNNDKRYWQILTGVLILVIMIMIFSFRSFNRELAGLAAAGAAQSNNTLNLTVTSARLVVRDQLPGRVVFVSSVDVPTGSWVVITDNADAIIGAGYFDALQNTGTIDLSTSTLENQNYFASLYRDNGDRRFILTTDEKWLDGTDQPITVQFRATRDLPEGKG